MSTTAISTKASSESLHGLTPDCSVDGCFRASAAVLIQTHPLWASPLRIDVCAKHQQAVTKEAKAAGVTVIVEHLALPAT
jgi:hypothetical protein